jgi:uncharacterized protein YvpB
MKITTLASMTVIGGTMAGSLMLSPVRDQPAAPATPVVQTLPSTGTQVAISRIRHGIDLEAPAAPTELYEQYVPPAPTPAPAPAAAPAAWAPTPGYVTIPVPIYRQTRNLNCETAAMQMGLAYYGHYYSQDYLFSFENPDLRAAQWINGVLHWGDPYTNFVGNVNGSESALTGYGVYYPVILSIARSHGVPNAYGGEGFSPATVYAELAAGHPVQIWMEARWSRPAMHTWIAWDGRSIRYSQAEHSVILTGVSPTSVRVNDDQFGSQYWVSKWTFETSWRDFNNMAVIYR